MKMASSRTPPDLPAHTDQRLSRIVRVLGDNAMLVVSGTKIAEEIGISRSEVWRLVQQLRASGVQIAGHPATGYRLESVPDLLLPDALDPFIQGTLFHGQLRHYFRVNSTNALAMQAGQAGAAEGTVFFAEEQTAGRGRGGHDWHSAPSTGIYVSILLRPAMAPAEVLTLSLMTGLAVAAAVEETTRLKPDLRWPNDLLLSRAAYTADGGCISQERKVCGILTELNAEATRIRFVVVGIGINVNQREFPPELAEIATSLRLESEKDWSRVQLAAALLQSFDREYRRFLEPEGRRHLLRRFEEGSSFARGRRVHVEEEGGYSGTTEGLDARGFLQLRSQDGKLRTVLSGTVRGI
jgi:BirA family biotin operon repressor/biotin-[acetyl-CoA-carboxylase] ligase